MRAGSGIKEEVTLHPTTGKPICASPKKLSRGGGICLSHAGRGTDHVGIGRCKLHGGTTQSGTSLMRRYGLQAHLEMKEIADLVDSLSQDREVYNFREHVYILEALAIHLINHQEIIQAAKIMVEVTKALQRLHEVEVGRRYVITVIDVRAIFDKFAEIVNRYVPDEYARQLIGKEMATIHFSSGDPSSQIKRLTAGVIEDQLIEA